MHDDREQGGVDRARRRLLEGACATTALLAALAATRAWAGGRPSPLDRWARDLAELNDRLARGATTAPDWQVAIERLNRSTPVSELVAYLDIDRLVRDFRYPTRLAEVADPKLPPHVLAPGRHRAWFVRVFGMRRDGAIIPHVHERMASAHLVVSGAFRVRTHDRVHDLDDAVVLRPSIDREFARGDLLSMSEQRDNQHWLHALRDRSLTLDVGVVGLPPSRTFRLPADENHMVFVDAGAKPRPDGLVVAPVMTFEACAAKYAGA